MHAGKHMIISNAAVIACMISHNADAGLSFARYNDPEPVKRLKREMEVALSEEDYATAGEPYTSVLCASTRPFV